MDIKKIINEEVNEWLDEALNLSRVPFPFRKVSNTRYVFDVNIPEKNYNVTYDVTFGRVGNEDEVGYSIAFGDGGYGDTGLGEPLRIMATVSNIVKDFIRENDPDILNFSPTRTGSDNRRNTNRRLDMYHYFVKQGAGDEYDGFIVGNKDMMTVEKRNPSFELENGVQDPETIQNIIKDLSLYGGRYETDDVPRNDPNYRVYSVGGWGGLTMQDGSGRQKRTISARKFVDWLLSDDVAYVQGRNEPIKYNEPEPTNQPVDAPIRRVGGRSQAGVAQLGTFQHFLNNNIYGFDNYQELQPFFDNHKNLADFNELKTKTERQMWTADDAEKDRLQGIVDAVDKLRREYDQYERNFSTRDTLNEIESQLMELIK